MLVQLEHRRRLLLFTCPLECAYVKPACEAGGKIVAYWGNPRSPHDKNAYYVGDKMRRNFLPDPLDSFRIPHPAHEVHATHISFVPSLLSRIESATESSVMELIEVCEGEIFISGQVSGRTGSVQLFL